MIQMLLNQLAEWRWFLETPPNIPMTRVAPALVMALKDCGRVFALPTTAK